MRLHKLSSMILAVARMTFFHSGARSRPQLQGRYLMNSVLTGLLRVWLKVKLSRIALTGAVVTMLLGSGSDHLFAQGVSMYLGGPSSVYEGANTYLFRTVSPYSSDYWTYYQWNSGSLVSDTSSFDTKPNWSSQSIGIGSYSNFSVIYHDNGTASLSMGGSATFYHWTGSYYQYAGYGNSANINITVLNYTPTLSSFTAPAIDEGQVANVGMTSYDQGIYDTQTFYVDSLPVGTHTSGLNTTRSISASLGPQYDSRTFTLHGQTQDKDGAWSAVVDTNLVVRNVAPIVTDLLLNSTSGNITVTEGTEVFGQMTATDPGRDALAFHIGGVSAGLGGDTPGSTRTSNQISLGTFYEHDGGSQDYAIAGTAFDGDDTSAGFGRILTVLNLDPILDSLTTNLAVSVTEQFSFAAASHDPGLDLLAHRWDLDNDGTYDDYLGESGSWSYSTPGFHTIGLQISDDDGGFAYGAFVVNVVPEPGSLAMLLGLALTGLLYGWRRRV